ncbi:MAG: aminoacyl-tRNA hydrolase [Melioribacter sp.]|nr:aminoacyl-tRNA hydrolase [Melioribacter sp.]
MRAVIGLGNPGKKYESTRHNIGFIILDELAEKYKITFKSSKKDYFYSEGSLLSSDFFLVKPTTYMNLSGIAVLDFISYYQIDVKDVLVIVDDVNLESGKIRLRQSGSDGGHNGLKSIIYHLENDNFPRLRFGIGNKFEKGKLAGYVLDKFSGDEIKIINESVNFSIDLIFHFITGGYKSMLDYFSKQKKLKTDDQNNSIEELN